MSVVFISEVNPSVSDYDVSFDNGLTWQGLSTCGGLRRCSNSDRSGKLSGKGLTRVAASNLRPTRES